MKRSNRLTLLLGVLIVICAATVLATQLESGKEQIKNTGEIILQIAPEEAETLSWEYGGSTLAFHREGEEWCYDTDESFPVDGEKLLELLSQFESLGVSFVIEDVTEPAIYGLDEPLCVIRFSTAEQSYTVELGDYSQMDEERYLSIGDGNVYLAKTDPLESFDATLSELIRHDRSLAYEQIEQIRFNGTENYTISCEEDSDAAMREDDVYFTQQNGEALALDTDRVESYLEALTTLELTDYVTYHATDEELEGYGLTDPELTVTVEHTTDGEEATYVLALSRDREELAAAEEAEAAGEEAEEVTAYVRVGDSRIVYRISAYSASALLAASRNELRHREVLVVDFDAVTQIDATLDGKDYTLLSEGDGDERIWRFDEEEIDLSALQSALEAVKAEHATDFTSQQPDGREELALTLHLADERRPTVEIGLYRHDGTSCLALVDGTPFAFVPRSDAVELIEAVNAIVLN